MSKTIPILERTIKCPKCERKTMRKSINSKAVFGSEYGREYFCDHCHIYLGVQELIDNWNYDLGDFGDCFPLDVYDSISKKNNFSKNNGRHPWMNLPIMRDWDTPEEDSAWNYLTQYHPSDWIEEFNQCVEIGQDIGEGGDWETKEERQDAYEMVDRMFTGVPEWEEGTTNEGIDIGIEGYPC